MKLLNLQEMNQVSGGDLSVNVSSTVPTDQAPLFANVLGLLLTGQLDAAAFAEQISANPDAFAAMPITSITIGNFSITPI